jgi:branched-chain amino acid transport system substrate-binding protein
MDGSLRRRGSVACAAATLALVVAACGSDNSGGSSAATTAAAAGTTAAATTAAATTAAATTAAGGATTTAGAKVDRKGETITIGYVNNEGGAFSLPEFRVGGEVAVDAINKAGGVNGAQIKLVMCLSDATPEGSINCANKFVDQKVNLVYAGIDVASDAFLPILSQAGIPYVSSNSWGPAQKNDPNSHLLHTAAGAFTVAPLKTLKDLGVKKAAVVLENTPAGQDFLNNVVAPIGEQKLGLEIQRILVDPANADYASAVGTAQAGGADAIWGQLTEPGCIGLATATNQLGFTGPVVMGSCTAYIQVLKDKAVGTYTSGDVFIPEIEKYAPADIQARLKTYTDNMTAAGQQQYLNGFAVAPYSGMFELASLLSTIPAGPINGAAINKAFTDAKTSPGYLGPDLHCAEQPWPTEKSHCRADILTYKVVKDESGNIVRQPTTPEFQDYSEFIK